MSTGPTFNVEWTVPTEDDDWGGDAPDASTAAATATRDTAPADERERLAERETRDLPPAPVLAARVDHLRSERTARESELDAIRSRYEMILEKRNAEISELRAQRSTLEALAARIASYF